jgi:hypothetical protein
LVASCVAPNNNNNKQQVFPMKKQALALGLTAVLYAFVFLPAGGLILFWMNFRPSFVVINFIALGASLLAAFKLARVVGSDDEQPPSLIVLLLFSAGYFLFMKLLSAFGINLGVGKPVLLLHRAEQWALIIAALLVSRFFKPRLMLFVGLMAFTMQFQAVGVLGPLAIYIPKVVQALLTLAVALFIARSFCVGDDSPADRVSNPLHLWLFAAAGTFALMISVNDFLVRSWVEKLVWISFLLSFVLLVHLMEPEDPEQRPKGLGADYGRVFLVFIAFFVVVAAVFQIHEVVDDWVPYTWSAGAQVWLPLLGCAAVAIALMTFLKIGARLPDYPSGRKAILWGAILYGIGILAGGSIFGGVSQEGKFIELLAVLVWFALLVVPLMSLALILMGTGLLRMLFSLNARPRG